MIWLVAAGLAVVAGGGVVCALRGGLVPGLWLQAGGMLAVGSGGAIALVTNAASGAEFTSGFELRAGLDGTSGLFLLTLGLVAVPALVFATGSLREAPRGNLTGALGGAFLVALVGVLVARDVISFLLWWELMTLLPAALILVGTSSDAARRTVFAYVAITHLGGAGTWIALLLLAHEGAIGGGAPPTDGSALQAVVAVAAIVGFGTKAGLMPMHAWLPRAHPIAPGHVSAVMSGAMVAVAVYGLVRVLVDWLGPVPSWIGALVVSLGALSALGGITYALFQRDLKRLLAYSTVEHLGLVALALGASLLLRRHGADEWASFALAAALLHVVNHASFKALLFLGAAAIERAAGSLELDRLGGLLVRLPWTGGAVLVGLLAIAGMPLLNGFASEWAILQALVHVPPATGVAAGTLGALALAVLAVTMAIGVLCFVKVIGLVLLGPPRRTACAEAVEPPRPMRWSVVGLAGACVALGAAPGVLFAQLVPLAPWPSPAEMPLAPGLELPGTGGLPTVGLLVVVMASVALLGLARGSRRAAPSPTWACGQPLTDSLLWTSAGFTKPLRLVLQPLLRSQREIETTVGHGGTEEVSYRGHVPLLIDTHLYGRVVGLALRGATRARRLQSGSLSAYVAYLVGLVLFLLLVVKAGVLG